jgi:hypothetical protein
VPACGRSAFALERLWAFVHVSERVCVCACVSLGRCFALPFVCFRVRVCSFVCASAPVHLRLCVCVFVCEGVFFSRVRACARACVCACVFDRVCRRACECACVIFLLHVFECLCVIACVCARMCACASVPIIFAPIFVSVNVCGCS